MTRRPVLRLVQVLQRNRPRSIFDHSWLRVPQRLGRLKARTNDRGSSKTRSRTASFFGPTDLRLRLRETVVGDPVCMLDVADQLAAVAPGFAYFAGLMSVGRYAQGRPRRGFIIRNMTRGRPVPIPGQAAVALAVRELAVTTESAAISAFLLPPGRASCCPPASTVSLHDGGAAVPAPRTSLHPAMGSSFR